MWEYLYMKQILLEFIPIILIFLLLTYTEKMVKWSNTSLGKLLIIFIILFYASIDKLYGILVCVLFILFYQSDTVENMLNIQNIDSFVPNNENRLEHTVIKPLEASCYTTQYELPKITTDIVKREFRQKHCHKGHLVNKGQKVKIDITEHVYPEVVLNDKCNICDTHCEFNIIDKQLNVGERLAPKFSR